MKSKKCLRMIRTITPNEAKKKITDKVNYDDDKILKRIKQKITHKKVNDDNIKEIVHEVKKEIVDKVHNNNDNEILEKTKQIICNKIYNNEIEQIACKVKKEIADKVHNYNDNEFKEEIAKNKIKQIIHYKIGDDEIEQIVCKIIKEITDKVHNNDDDKILKKIKQIICNKIDEEIEQKIAYIVDDDKIHKEIKQIVDEVKQKIANKINDNEVIEQKIADRIDNNVINKKIIQKTADKDDNNLIYEKIKQIIDEIKQKIDDKIDNNNNIINEILQNIEQIIDVEIEKKIADEIKILKNIKQITHVNDVNDENIFENVNKILGKENTISKVDIDDEILKETIKYNVKKRIVNKISDNYEIKNRKIDSRVLINVLGTGFLNYIVYSHHRGDPRKSLLEKIASATNLKDLKIAFIKVIEHPDYIKRDKIIINKAYNNRKKELIDNDHKEELIDNDHKKELDSESIEIKTQC